MGLLGGFQGQQLAPNIYRVGFFGNGYTNPRTAVEYVIRRCAELTQQRGYHYFGILAVTDASTTRTFTIPGHAYTTGTVSAVGFGNSVYGSYSGTTFYTPAQTISFNFPRPIITIKMTNSWTKDANLVDASMIMSVQMEGVRAAPMQQGPSYSGPRMVPTRLPFRCTKFHQCTFLRLRLLSRHRQKHRSLLSSADLIIAPLHPLPRVLRLGPGRLWQLFHSVSTNGHLNWKLKPVHEPGCLSVGLSTGREG
jgi:hypothetical protein